MTQMYKGNPVSLQKDGNPVTRLTDAEIEMVASSAFEATKQILEAVENHILPIIISQLGTSESEEILIGTYGRIALLGGALKQLPAFSHFQTVRISARTAFELLLDIRALADAPGLAAKVSAFTKVQKYNQAIKMIEAMKGHETKIASTRYRHEAKYVSDPEVTAEYEKLCREHWPTRDARRLDHWSGKTIAERAEAGGAEVKFLYRHDYALNCTLSHSGVTFIQDMPEIFFINAYGVGHVAFQKIMLNATKEVCRVFKILEAFPGIGPILDRLAMLTFEIADRTAAFTSAS